MLLPGIFTVFAAICTRRPIRYVPMPSTELRYRRSAINFASWSASSGNRAGS